MSESKHTPGPQEATLRKYDRHFGCFYCRLRIPPNTWVLQVGGKVFHSLDCASKSLEAAIAKAEKK